MCVCESSVGQRAGPEMHRIESTRPSRKTGNPPKSIEGREDLVAHHCGQTYHKKSSLGMVCPCLILQANTLAHFIIWPMSPTKEKHKGKQHHHRFLWLIHFVKIACIVTQGHVAGKSFVNLSARMLGKRNGSAWDRAFQHCAIGGPIVVSKCQLTEGKHSTRHKPPGDD